jgi:serine/threonine protein kinase
MSAQGSPGLLAPETIMHFAYSCKSDIWQLGCILYSLLSATHPFSPSRVDRILKGQYFPMEGEAWRGVSEEAKGVVAWMLQTDPTLRPSATDLLQHSWLSSTAAVVASASALSETPENTLTEHYANRLKGLVLAQKLRSVFLSRDLESRDVERNSQRDLLHGLRVEWSNEPIFSPPERSVGGVISVGPESIDEYDSTDESSDNCEDGNGNVDIEEKLDLLREKSFPLASLNSDASHVDISVAGTAENTVVCDFPLFVDLLSQCQLHKLATVNVFKIFNHRGDNKINLEDFIESMRAVFRKKDPLDQLTTFPIAEDIDPEDEEAHTIFQMLDAKRQGFIQLSDMKVGLRCIMLAEYMKSHHRKISFGAHLLRGDSGGFNLPRQRSSRSSLTHSTYQTTNSLPMSVKSADVEQLFDRLVKSPAQNDCVDFEAFKDFYTELVATSGMSPSLTVPGGIRADPIVEQEDPAGDLSVL